MTSSHENSTIADGLALAATMSFEMGDPADEARVKIRALWEQVGTPAGVFQAAAAAITLIPDPAAGRAEPTGPIERPRDGREEFEAQSLDQEREAALKARALLQDLANELG